MGPQCRLGIYIGFDSPSIIRYLEPLASDIFKAHFEDCHFDEIYSQHYGKKSRCQKYNKKSLRIIRRYLILIIVQINLN
jgi:hypothetical protein